MAQLGMIIAADPKLQAVLLGIAGRWQRRNMRAEEVATHIFGQLVQRGIKRGDARRGQPRLIVLPPQEDRRSIESPTRGDTTSHTRRKRNHASNNQEPRTTHRRQSRSVRQTPLD